MARCEDYPACGHEAGCCPDFDESGKQLNMKCVCGATVPLESRVSLCPECLKDPDDPYGGENPDGYEDDEWCDEFEDEDDDDDFEDDGQPSEYTEWQDFNGGDDWDQGQYDE